METLSDYNFETQHQPEDFKIPIEIDSVFDSNPELSSIGTKKEYSEYIKSIFPESKFQDIVWHGTNSDEDFDKFDKNRESNFGFRKHGAVFFTSSIEDAKSRGSGSDKKQAKRIIPAIVNLKNPLISGQKEIYEERDDNVAEGDEQIANLLAVDNIYELWANKNWKHRIEDNKLILTKPRQYTATSLLDSNNNLITDLSNNMGFIGNVKEDQCLKWQSQGFDGIIDSSEIAKLSGLAGEKTWLVVFDSDNIHILGSDQDKQKFKEFVETEK